MSNRTPLVYFLCLAACLAIIAAGLHFWGAMEIRTDPSVVVFLTVMGAAVLLLATNLFAWLNISFIEDVIERKNVSAVVALCGALFSVALIYTGGNIGEGPSYSNNFFSIGIGIAYLLVLWIFLEIAAAVSISITEERDLGSGVRLCGFLGASGLIIGRAVAGDWHSASATFIDMISDGWPAIAVCALAVIAEKLLRPRRSRPFPSWRSSGLPIASLYLAVAIGWLWHLGPWEGKP